MVATRHACGVKVGHFRQQKEDIAMKKDILFRALLTAAIVTVTGAALAAGPQVAMGPDTGGSGTNGMKTQAAPATPGAQPTVAAQPALPPESVVGKDVTNADGDSIGKVSKISGDQVIVSVGGFLGIGTHEVALNWNQLTATGSGDDMKLQTALTKDELKNLPEYKE